MNYRIIYQSIVDIAKSENRKKLKLEDPAYIYYERHHIVPRCLGGNNEPENLVLLTAKEHYVCHRILSKLSKTPEERKSHAHALMRFLNSDKENIYNINSRDYSMIKSEHAKYVSLQMSGKKFTEEHRYNLSKSILKHFESAPGHFAGLIHTEETKLKMSISQSGENNHFHNKHHTEEVKLKISKSLTGIKRSAEFIQLQKDKKQSTESKEKISEGLRKYHAERKRLKEIK